MERPIKSAVGELGLGYATLDASTLTYNYRVSV